MLPQELPFSSSFDVVTSALSSDLDADGRAEVALATAGGRILVYKEGGRGGFDPVWTSQLSDPVVSLAVEDLTGDGANELCAMTTR